MRIWSVIYILGGLTCLLAGCPAPSRSAGGSERGKGDSENRQEERDDDEGALPRLLWSVADAWEQVPGYPSNT